MSDEKPFDAGDPSDVKKIKKVVVRKEKRDEEDLKAVLATRAGRNLVWRILSEAGIYHNSFQPGDPHMTSFREGRRAVGTWLLKECFTSSPGSYRVMQDEAEQAGK